MEYLCSTRAVYGVLVGALAPDKGENILVVAGFFFVATRNVLKPSS